MLLRIGEHYINTEQVTYWQVNDGQPGIKQVWVYFDNSAESSNAIQFNGVQAAAVVWWLERSGGEDLLDLHRMGLDHTTKQGDG